MQPDGIETVNFHYENRDRYLYVFLDGPRGGYPVALKVWRRVIDECHARGFTRLLVEQDFPDPLSLGETYDLAEAVSRMPVSTLKLALVDRDTTQNNINMFAETVAVNRGVVGRLFSNVKDAEAYLLK
jgi:hypothetical protein